MHKRNVFNIIAGHKCIRVHLAKMFAINMSVIFCVMNCVAQNQVKDSLQVDFDSYRQNNLQEKIFLHTDKEFYLAGEICWFKIYDVDASFHMPLGISKVAYVEVIDKNNMPRLQAKISLNEGFGNGFDRVA